MMKTFWFRGKIMSIEDREFYVVYAVEPNSDSFEVMGVLTNETDALALKEELLADPKYHNVVATDKLSMKQIKTQLIRDRLMELAEAVTTLVDKVYGEAKK